MNLTLISSVINITNKPLSYTQTRSIYSKYERYEQTIKTIESVKKIQDNKILFVEASEIKEFEQDIINRVDYYKNIYDINNKNIIDGLHKGVGEAFTIIEGLKNIDLSLYDNIYKIAGRYALNDNFNYSLWNNDNTILCENKFHHIIITVFYKINKNQYQEWFNLLNKMINTNDNRGIEVIFKNEMKNYTPIYNIGAYGNVSVSGDYWEL